MCVYNRTTGELVHACSLKLGTMEDCYNCSRKQFRNDIPHLSMHDNNDGVESHLDKILCATIPEVVNRNTNMKSHHERTHSKKTEMLPFGHVDSLDIYRHRIPYRPTATDKFASCVKIRVLNFKNHTTSTLAAIKRGVLKCRRGYTTKPTDLGHHFGSQNRPRGRNTSPSETQYPNFDPFYSHNPFDNDYFTTPSQSTKVNSNAVPSPGDLTAVSYGESKIDDDHFHNYSSVVIPNRFDDGATESTSSFTPLDEEEGEEAMTSLLPLRYNPSTVFSCLAITANNQGNIVNHYHTKQIQPSVTSFGFKPVSELNRIFEESLRQVDDAYAQIKHDRDQAGEIAQS